MPRSTEYGSSHPVLSLLPSGKQIRLSIRRPLQNEMAQQKRKTTGKVIEQQRQHQSFHYESI